MFLSKIANYITSFYNYIRPTLPSIYGILQSTKQTIPHIYGFLTISKVITQSDNKKSIIIPIKTESHRIPPGIRNSVWSMYYRDSMKGICYCCGTTIEKLNGRWHCSHILSLNKGGDTTIKNLRPCCSHCNLSMGNQNLYTYIRDKNLTGPGRRNVEAYFKAHPSQINDKRTNNWGKK